MYNPNNDLSFEDLFEIVTPSGVDTRILNLDAAWEALYLSDKNNKYVNNEYNAWNNWSNKVLESSLSKWFASGTLKELDEWKERYKLAHSKIKNNSAPDPRALNTDKLNIWNSPGFWVAAGAGLAIGAILLVNLSSGKAIKSLVSSTSYKKAA
jgi:hypothetical protein